uniref:Uncharacterized protein n=1 Tax=Megaviridae environmental sample TaxID=1737588 RepID=A0A5J6VK92_9VIRU|nr:MAG: hypothetical protein [Megaviridae environmental sample]
MSRVVWYLGSDILSIKKQPKRSIVNYNQLIAFDKNKNKKETENKTIYSYCTNIILKYFYLK